MDLQRRDYRFLADAIPPKEEYAVKVRLTESQAQLYRHFLDGRDRFEGWSLNDQHILTRIATHPHLLISRKREANRKNAVREFPSFLFVGGEWTAAVPRFASQCWDDYGHMCVWRMHLLSLNLFYSHDSVLLVETRLVLDSAIFRG